MTAGRTGVRSASGVEYLLRGVGRRKKPQWGFTLVELMIGVVLVAVLLGIGMPAFRSFILEQRLRATSSDLRVALTLARSEAIKRNREVELLSNTNTTDWSDGWTIPTPPDDNDDNDDLDILNHKQSGDVTIGGPVEVIFTPAGRTPSAAAFNIDVGADDEPKKGALGCLRSQLDGRTDYCPWKCPIERCTSGPMKDECRCPVGRQSDDGTTCLPCPT